MGPNVNGFYFTIFKSPFVCARCLLKLERGRPSQRRWIAVKVLAKEREAKRQWDEQAQRIKGGEQSSFLTLLEERGLVKDFVGHKSTLDKILTEKRAGAYIGVDPTAPSLHIGHMVTLMPLFWMYAHGYKAFTLIGGATAKIGDPTGRTSLREPQTAAERKANMIAMHLQIRTLWARAERLLDAKGYKWGWAWKRGLVNNNAWWNKQPLLEVIKELGPGVRIGPMLGRDNVKTRLENGDGMSFAEFTYPILQCWDWWQLYTQQGIQIQIGGSDQYGNILSGVEGLKYIAKNHSDPAQRVENLDVLQEPVGITVPLLTNSSGEKLGKSAGNAVWLDQEKTSAFELYQFFLRIADADVERFLKQLTFLPIPEIMTIVKNHMQAPEKRTAQHVLAREFLELVHGPADAKDAEAQHRLVFSGKLPLPSPSLKKRDPNPAIYRPSPHLKLPREMILTQAMSRILVAAGLASSRSEAHRLIEGNGAHIGARADKSKMSDDMSFTPLRNWVASKNADFIIDDELLILRVGKWKLKIIKLVSEKEFEKEGLRVPGWPPEQIQAPEEALHQAPVEKVGKTPREKAAEQLAEWKQKGHLGPGLKPRFMKERAKFAQAMEKEESRLNDREHMMRREARLIRVQADRQKQSEQDKQRHTERWQ